MTFDSGGAPGYTGNVSNTQVIYIAGNADWGNVQFDLKKNNRQAGAFIVTGNLTLDDKQATTGGTPADTRVPATALLEYPFFSKGHPYYIPCKEEAGLTCNSIGPAQFRGFLYVGGDLTVKKDNNWVLLGALRIDGKLTVEPGASLTVYYDDEIGHTLLTNGISLQLDSLSEISPS